MASSRKRHAVSDVEGPEISFLTSSKSQKNAKNKTGSDESWRDGSVARRNLHMLNSESMADCTFVVGAVKKMKFLCHKLILSHGSSVFYAMYNGALKEKGEVKVEDIEPKPFRKMLEFIYSDNTKLENVESALSVCYAANKYMINTLVLKCVDFIKENLDLETVCRALEFARLIDNADLEAESLQYLQTNVIDVLKSSSFLNAEKATLLIILNQDDLSITSEVELYSACIRWAKAQQRDNKISLRDVLGLEVLSLLRFLTLSVQEFITIIIPSKLLQLQEEQIILYRLVTGTGSMPQGFNTNTESRVLFGHREIIKLTGCSDDYFYSSIGEKTKPLSLKVDVDSYIFGVQLSGILRGEPVQDSFEVKLCLASDLVAFVKFEGEVSAGTVIEITFSRPVLLQANTDYTLQVKYSNANTYRSTRYYYGRNEYTTTAGVKMSVNFSSTTISQIYIAKKRSNESGYYF